MDEIVETEAVIEPEEVKPAPKKRTRKPSTTKAPAKKKAKTFDPNEYVSVKNGFHGRLYYRNKSTGETFEWSEFGDEVDMTIGELRRARSAQPRFFEENWFIIEDPDLMEYLRVGKYYKTVLNEKGFDELFSTTPEDATIRTTGLSQGQRRSIVYEARKRIEDGSLNDLRLIKALEESLNVNLISE